MTLIKQKLEETTKIKQSEPLESAAAKLTPEQMRLGQRLMVQEGALWSFMNALSAPGGLVVTAFAIYLKADAFVIGLVSALPLLAALLQLWSPQLLVRFGGRKRVTFLTLAIARLLLFPLTLLALAAWLLPEQHSVWLVLLLLIVTAFAALTSIGGTTWLSWASTVIPISQRAVYFARRNTIIGALGLAITFLAGFFLDWWIEPTPNGHRAFPLAYVVLFLIAALFGLITVYLLQRTPDITTTVPKEAPRPRLFDSLKETWQYLPLRRFLIFRAVSLFAVTLVVPYYTVYLLQNLKMSFTEISVLQNVGTLAGLIGMPLWGRALDRFGCSRVLFWTTAFKVFYVVFWAFVVPGQPFIPLLLIHITLIIDAGQTLAASNLLMNLMPRQDASNVGFYSVYTALTSVVSGVGPFVAGILIGCIGSSQLLLFGLAFGAIQLMFILSGVLRLFALTLFRGIKD